jgi:hypothetical protein
MTAEDLTQIISWSEKTSPPNQLAANDGQEKLLAEKHAMMRAYMTMGFTLWTRYVLASHVVRGNEISSGNQEL